jgi:nitrate reductase NapA
MSFELTRRELLKAGFTTAVVGAAGTPLRAFGSDEPKGWRWDRGVCRFCGVGCGIQVASAEGRVVAVKGDPASPVNRGLLCAKGYALPQIQYGADRLTRPLLRMRNGAFDKRGEFVPVSWTAPST